MNIPKEKHMDGTREVVILSGVPLPSAYGGSLRTSRPPSSPRVVRGVARAKVDPKDIGQCVFGT
jgi:hypothetical protein